jgi:hypothetical protein
MISAFTVFINELFSMLRATDPRDLIANDQSELQIQDGYRGCRSLEPRNPDRSARLGL